MSEWVIHFVHERKPESETSLLQDFFEPGYTGEFKYPDYFDSFGEGQCIFSTYDENEYKIPRGANAFQVLLKILHDGFLYSGWSRRNGSPTIYGPRSSVCFTENPGEAHREFDCGWTYICTSEVNEISQALVSLGFTSYADGIYRKNIISHCRDSLTTQTVGAEVAADYLTEELGQDFYVMTHQD